MDRKEVAISGLGIIGPSGSNVEEYWSNLCQGKSAIDAVSRFPNETESRRKWGLIAGEIRKFPFYEELSNKEKRFDRTAQYALAAADEALIDSGLDMEAEDRSRCGVILGSSRGAAELLEKSHANFTDPALRSLRPHTSPFTTMSSISTSVARRFGLQGVNLSCSATCTSSTHAIGLALEKIQLGKADIIFAGGSDACITPFHFAQYGAAGVLAACAENPQTSCRPFDLHRSGMVLAEGAGLLILEEMDHAKKRGARIYARLTGFGASCDAMGFVSMPEDGRGLRQAMELALNDAKARKEDVDYISAHGTGTKMNDRIETTAMKLFFGRNAYKIPLSSVKSMTGHSLGASGAMEAILCALIIRDGILPPTMHLASPDPACDLDYVPNEARPASVSTLLSNSMGFGGLNASLVLQKV